VVDRATGAACGSRMMSATAKGAESHWGVDLSALQAHLEARDVTVAGPLVGELIEGGKSNLTLRVTDGVSAWVVRRPPTAGRTPSAHDVGREFAVTAALQGSGVPVARTIALVEDPLVADVPLTVVDFVDGQVLRTCGDLDRHADQDLVRCTTELVHVLAALHSVPYEAVGLGGFGRPEGYLTRQVRRWGDQWGRVATREIADVDRLRNGLAELVPASSEATIVHGDYRCDNTILASDDIGRVVAVVDWELSTLGDPLSDVAMMMVYTHESVDQVLGFPAAATCPRMPGADDIAEAYARAAERDLSRLSFHLGLAFFKLAVIAAGIDARHRAGATSGPGFDTAINAVEPLVAAGLVALRRTDS
jgi:aminoglycoside phosphotransferase (APT) family kinase protein